TRRGAWGPWRRIPAASWSACAPMPMVFARKAPPRFRDQEEGPMIAASRNERDVDQLVHANRRLVDHMVNRYLGRFHTPTMEREDLVSWGLMGLVNAARAWDPDRGAFASLACCAIERMIVRGVSREWRPEREPATVSLDQVYSDPDSGNEEVRGM